MDWKKNLKNPFRKYKNHPITEDSFLDVHQIYDKNDFITECRELIQSNLLLWQNSLKAVSPNKKILIPFLNAGFSHRPLMRINYLLSLALTLRGAKVENFICDHVLPVCLKSEYSYIKPEIIHHSKISQTLCKGCFTDSFAISAELGLTTHRMSQFVNFNQRLNAKEIAKNVAIKHIKNFSFNGIAIGKHAFSGAVRYFAHGDPTAFPLGIEMMRSYLEASIISYFAITKLFEENHYEQVCIPDGEYVPAGVIKEICQHRNIPIVIWAVSYLKSRFNFAHGDPLTYLRHEPNIAWENLKWDEKAENEIMKYLNSRWNSSNDWIPVPKQNQTIPFLEFAKEKNINLNKPIIGLLTNIIWESYGIYTSQIFPDMLTWINKTINYFKKRQDLQLLIRIHPAEAERNSSKQLVMDEIKKVFKKLPSNVFIIEAERNVNTYEAMHFCDSVLIYQTQTGIELAAMFGTQVIVAGDAWIRNKKIAHEPMSEVEYYKMLDQLPLKNTLSEEAIQRARKFAYHVFYRKSIPLSFIQESHDWTFYKSNLKKLDDLLPDADKGLDVVCNGILNKTPLIYPAENY